MNLPDSNQNHKHGRLVIAEEKKPSFFQRHRKTVYSLIFFGMLWSFALSLLEWEDSLRLLSIIVMFIGLFLLATGFYYLGRTFVRAIDPFLSWLFIKEPEKKQEALPDKELITAEQAKNRILELLSRSDSPLSYRQIMDASFLEKDSLDKLLKKMVAEEILSEDLEVDEGQWYYHISSQYLLEQAKKEIHR
jgi:hypothetical protein